jgi:hypothetical protein
MEMKMAIYVTMTDKFMSGWGQAEGLINKYVIECESQQQAQICVKNARLRSEMKYINIVRKKPYYNQSRYLVSLKKFSELGSIWTSDPDAK